MAETKNKNKVVYDGEVLIDLTADTITADKLAKGIGDDAQIWFSENTKDGMTPVKIVHGKNLCTYDENATPIKRKPATCTEDGYEIYQECTYEKNLGATDPWHKGTVTKVLPATGHDWGDWEVVTPATCTKTGLKKRTCKNNPEHFETEVIPVVSDAHTWNDGEVTKAPTCTEKGEKTFTCTNCNATKTEEIPVDPNAHNYTREEGEKEWDEIIPATCTTAGTKVKHCKNALNDKTHDLVETIAIDKDAHNWGEWTTTKKATCTADGEQERVCKNDTTHKETKKIDATGHQHTKIVGKKDATETEPGYTGDKVCDKCGEIIEKGEVIPAKGHTWVKGEHHDANCMKGGYDDYTCSGCGATKEEPDGTTPNNDHDYSGEEGDEITNATCTTDGKKVKHCKRPGADATHDKTEVIPATGHAPSESWKFDKADHWKDCTNAGCGVIIESSKRSRVVDYNDLYVSEFDYSTYSRNVTGYDAEGQITSAISYVLSEDMPKLYMVTGHGELELDSAFTDILQKANIDTQTVNLMNYDTVPEDAMAVFVNAPTEDNNDWYKSDIDFTITAKDEDSGIGSVMVKINNQDRQNQKLQCYHYTIRQS